MVLNDFATSGSWIQMHWACAFKTKWAATQKAVKQMEKYFSDMEVLTGGNAQGGQIVNINTVLEEKELLVFRGKVKLFGDALFQVAVETGSQKIIITTSAQYSADYETLAKTFGAFMDGFEMMMYYFIAKG